MERCWTISYVDEANFHIDILPCIDDSIGYHKILDSYSLSFERDSEYIAITDKNNESYTKISNDWEISNPKGFAEWFFTVSNFEEKRQILAKMENASIEKIKVYNVKTDLQRFIQLLKRHRDIFFKDNSEYKVTSVIITTLAGKLYETSEKKSDTMECFRDIIKNLPTPISYRNNEMWLANPANTLENFLDKWKNKPKYKQAFNNWHKSLLQDIGFYHQDFNYYPDNAIQRMNQSLGVLHPKNTSNEELLNRISHRKKPKWQMTNSISVTIEAKKRMEKGFSIYRTFESGSFLPKGVDLKFEAKTSNIKEYTVHWQITNTGIEAESSQCLRGDFYDGEIEEGKRIRKESTMYAGSHIVECYLVKDEICMGKSDPFIVNITSNSIINTGW